MKLYQNKLANQIINLLSKNFPLTTKQIQKTTKYSYKYVHKILKQLEKESILSFKKRKYKLSLDYLKKLKHFTNIVTKNYSLNQNVFLTTINSEILNVLSKKELKKILNQKIIEKLHEWYTAYYDPENKELKKIYNSLDLKDKTVLELGCGTGRLTFEIAKKCKNLTAIDKDLDYINFCKQRAKKIKNIKFLHQNISNLNLKNKFDIIISSWVGLHYSNNLNKIINNLFSLLKQNGKLLIIEAYPKTEYIKILNILRKKQTNIIKKQKNLEELLLKKFGNIKKEVVKTYYKFPNYKKLEETFRIELSYEEGIYWKKQYTKKLKKYLSTKKHPLIIEEAPLFFLSIKSTK